MSAKPFPTHAALPSVHDRTVSRVASCPAAACIPAKHSRACPLCHLPYMPFMSRLDDVIGVLDCYGSRFSDGPQCLRPYARRANPIPAAPTPRPALCDPNVPPYRALIAKHFRTRTDADVKNIFYSTLRSGKQAARRTSACPIGCQVGLTAAVVPAPSAHS